MNKNNDFDNLNKEFSQLSKNSKQCIRFLSRKNTIFRKKYS